MIRRPHKGPDRSRVVRAERLSREKTPRASLESSVGFWKRFGSSRCPSRAKCGPHEFTSLSILPVGQRSFERRALRRATSSSSSSWSWSSTSKAEALVLSLLFFFLLHQKIPPRSNCVTFSKPTPLNEKNESRQRRFSETGRVDGVGRVQAARLRPNHRDAMCVSFSDSERSRFKSDHATWSIVPTTRARPVAVQTTQISRSYPRLDTSLNHSQKPTRIAHGGLFFVGRCRAP